MTDRELLELAAKAAGIKGEWDDAYGAIVIGRDSQGVAYAVWAPHLDDGVAFRLAVKLELDIFNSCISVRAIHREMDTGATIRCRGSKPQLDPYAATRRAIVRAAAEIGAKNAQSR